MTTTPQAPAPRRPLLLAACLLAAAATATADPMQTWPSLREQTGPQLGLFRAWSVDQRQVLAAMRKLAHAQPQRQIRQLEQRIAQDPANLGLRDLLGMAHWRTGRLHEAVAHFRTVLRLDPACERTRLNLAELFANIGATDRAHSELAQGMAKAPNSARLRRFAAQFLAAAGRHAAAAVCWQNLATLRHADFQAWVGAAREFLLAGEKTRAKAAMARAAPLAGSDPARRTTLGDLHRAFGQWSAAREVWRDVLSRHHTSRATVRLALLDIRDREFADAARRLQAIPDTDPNAPLALAAAAVAAQALDDQAAVMQATRRLRNRGHVRLAAQLLADLWLARGDATAAHAAVASAAAQGVRVPLAYDELLDAVRTKPASARRQLALLASQATLFAEAGWWDCAIAFLDAARKLAPHSLTLGLLLADAHARAGDGDGELDLRQQLAKLNPDSSKAHCGLARALIQRRQWQQAEEVLRAFLRQHFSDPDARLLAAQLALRTGQFATALADCRAGLSVRALDQQLYATQLDALLQAGRLSEAKAAIHSREGASPTFTPGPLEQALLALASDQRDQCLEHAMRGIALAPHDHRLWLVAGRALERKGAAAEAARHYQVAAWLRPHHYPVQLALARVAARAGLAAIAREAYRNALRLNADSAELRIEAADALAARGRHDEALAVLRTAEPADPALREQVRARTAEILIARGDPKAALDIVQAILQKQPGDPIAWRTAVRAQRALGDLAGAIQTCEAAQKAAARPHAELALLYLLQQRLDEAREQLSEALLEADTGAARASLRRLQAIAFIARGDQKRAEGALDEARAVLQAGPPTDIALPLAYAAAGAPAKAKALLPPATRVTPTWTAWVTSAMARLAADRRAAALALSACAARVHGWPKRSAELFAAALERAPGEHLLLHESARAHADAGELAAAVAVARQLAAACPKAGEPQFLLGSLLDKQGKADAAIRAYAQALKLFDGPAVPARTAIAERLAAAGRTDEAIAAYRSVVEAEPANLTASNRLAWLYATYEPDHLPDALRLAQAAAKGRPSDPACRDTLGWCLVLDKKPDQGRQELLAALALEPENALFYYHLGMADFLRGSRHLARRALRLALAIDPKLPDAASARTTLDALEADAALEGPCPDAPW